MREPLEKELGRLVPLPPSENLEKRIASALTYRGNGATSPLADTALRSLVTLGAAAAVVIVTLVASDWSSGQATVRVESAATGTPSDPIRVADTPRLLARLPDSSSMDFPALPQN